VAEGYITINQYLAVLRKTELMPQVITLHESIEAFHASSEYHPESERAEKTLNVHQFQHVLHVLLADKELGSIGTNFVSNFANGYNSVRLDPGRENLSELGTLNGLAGLASDELSFREQLMKVMSPTRSRSRSRQRIIIGVQVGVREKERRERARASGARSVRKRDREERERRKKGESQGGTK
jgi:hypothetical protein